MSRNTRLTSLPGRVFFRLTVIKESGQRTESGELMYECQCRCGNVVVIRGSSLRKGTTKSCGCLRAERSKLEMLRRHEDDKLKCQKTPPPMTKAAIARRAKQLQELAGVSPMDILWMNQYRRKPRPSLAGN